MQEFLSVLGLMLAYGVFHSILAANGFKLVMLRIMGKRFYQGFYRLIFNGIAVVTFLPVFFYIAFNSGPTVWRINGFWVYLLYGLQLLGITGLAISLLQIDGERFLGMRQLEAWLNNKPLPLPPEPLTTDGVYALVRHPLYLFSLMLIWPVATMTSAYLGFAVGATAYFALGSLLEEQKLRQYFGDAYAAYQQRVPWLIPFLRLPSPPR